MEEPPFKPAVVCVSCLWWVLSCSLKCCPVKTPFGEGVPFCNWSSTPVTGQLDLYVNVVENIKASKIEKKDFTYQI